MEQSSDKSVVGEITDSRNTPLADRSTDRRGGSLVTSLIIFKHLSDATYNLNAINRGGCKEFADWMLLMLVFFEPIYVTWNTRWQSARRENLTQPTLTQPTEATSLLTDSVENNQKSPKAKKAIKCAILTNGVVTQVNTSCNVYMQIAILGNMAYAPNLEEEGLGTDAFALILTATLFIYMITLNKIWWPFRTNAPGDVIKSYNKFIGSDTDTQFSNNHKAGILVLLFSKGFLNFTQVTWHYHKLATMFLSKGNCVYNGCCDPSLLPDDSDLINDIITYTLFAVSVVGYVMSELKSVVDAFSGDNKGLWDLKPQAFIVMLIAFYIKYEAGKNGYMVHFSEQFLSTNNKIVTSCPSQYNHTEQPSCEDRSQSDTIASIEPWEWGFFNYPCVVTYAVLSVWFNYNRPAFHANTENGEKSVRDYYRCGRSALGEFSITSAFESVRSCVTSPLGYARVDA